MNIAQPKYREKSKICDNFRTSLMTLHIVKPVTNCEYSTHYDQYTGICLPQMVIDSTSFVKMTLFNVYQHAYSKPIQSVQSLQL